MIIKLFMRHIYTPVGLLKFMVLFHYFVYILKKYINILYAFIFFNCSKFSFLENIYTMPREKITHNNIRSLTM